MKEVSSVIIPAEAGYLTAIRLFASAVAAKKGYDVDIAEDIKLCTTEACMLLINQPYTVSTLAVDISLGDGSIEIALKADGTFTAIEKQISEEMGLGQDILEALTDQLAINSENGVVKSITFSKTVPER